MQESVRQLLFTSKTTTSKVMAPLTAKRKKKKKKKPMTGKADPKVTAARTPKVDSKVIKNDNMGKLVHCLSTNVNSSSSLVNCKTSQTPLSRFFRIH